ncbi:putative kinase, partial [Blastocystis sp. subtype 1]
DVWCLGISLIEMAEGKNPFEGCNQMQLMKKLMTESPSLSGEGWSAECVDFVGKCVVRSVEERWTVSQLMDHPFVKESVERIRREGVSPVLAQWAGVKEENTTEGNCEEKEENTTQNECEEKENTTQNESKEETIPPMEELPENGIVTCKAALDALTEQVSCITVQSCADYRSEVLDFSRFANL